MKLMINKNVKVDPDWKDLIGKKLSDVEDAINEFCSHPIKTIATGYNHYECVSYQTQTTKAVLFFDESGCLLDVFVYSFDIEAPRY